MKRLNKIIKIIKNPRFIMMFLSFNNIIKLSDEFFLNCRYEYNFNKKLNLNNPQTFNEKLQWLKLNDRKSIYTTMVDKFEAKKYVTQKIGKKCIIQTLGIYNKFDEIDFNSLPNQFVIKCTHDSGGVIIVKDKASFNIKHAKKIINKGLKTKYYYAGREWPYKDVIPRIIIEEYLGENLTDYRFYCFNSEPKYTYVYLNESQKDGSKPEPNYCNIYDMNWEKQKFRNKCSSTEKEITKPCNFELMKEISQKLSYQIPFLRVDFYEIDGTLFVGELTFSPGSGFSRFFPEEADKMLGDMLKLPEKISKNEK